MNYCEGCGAMLAGRADARFCSGACRQRAYRSRITSAPAGTLERNHQEAELINAFRSMVRPLLDPDKLSTLSPKAQDLLIDTFEHVILTIRNARSGVTDSGGEDR